MPIPFIFLAIGATTGVSGSALGIHSVVKISDSKSYMSEAERIQSCALERFKSHSKEAVLMADRLGIQEVKILKTFRVFSDYIEKIQERPVFKSIRLSSFKLDNSGIQELKRISNGVEILMGTAGSMVLGVAGGFAAAGATTSVISMLGAASTGTAIADLSGIAATNATLATLGGGSLATGGGGIVLGSTVLGVSSAGIGLLMGGIVFEIIAKKLSDSAELAMEEAKKTEEKVKVLVNFCDELKDVTHMYCLYMSKIANKYFEYMNEMIQIIKNKRDFRWSNFTESEKKIIENTILYVTILYNMCKVQIAIRRDNEPNRINKIEVQRMLDFTEKYIA